jgi:PBSX family phage terminase large subunit
MMTLPLSPKQVEFLINSTAQWNLAHGAVSTGKTIGTAFRFMQAVDACPDSEIAMIGKTSTTLYNNVINLLFEYKELAIYRPFCTWMPSKRELKFKDKTITTYGAKDEGAVQLIQGRSLSLAYCDEMTLYPESFIHMLDSRLRKEHSMGFAAMNPAHPDHIIKHWIDKGLAGDKNYYSLHFVLEDNPYLTAEYKARMKSSLTGVFYKRNYLGLWCLAEGAIFDFLDRQIHVVKKPPRAAEYWIAGIDYGFTNNFACELVGINTGISIQSNPIRWVEKEYVWNSKKMQRSKTNVEYARDVYNFLEPYSIKGVYVDPSAAAFIHELRKLGLHVIEADNDVLSGISFMTSEMSYGRLYVCEDCPNLIREMESYVWDAKAAEKGEDAPLKKDDHCLDALRYAIYTHKVPTYQPYAKKADPTDYLSNRFQPRGRTF